MKRAGNLIEEIQDINNLYWAYYKARRGKAGNSDAMHYAKNLHENIHALREQIISGNVSVGNYHYFTIRDPKVRLICAAAFEERVLHHALMNVCHKYFERHMIYDTYATRIDKGIYAALDKAQAAMLKYDYAGKLDFKKYFNTISHDILKEKLRRMYKDKRLLSIFDKIIDSYETSENRGIPIGNLTSQYFANFYLSEMDHYAKEVLRIPVYIRYMDDILVFAHDKSALKNHLSNLRKMASEKLSLTFKPFIIIQYCQGVSFLGYKLYRHKCMLNSSSRKRFAAKINLYDKRLQENLWDETVFLNHITPLLAFARYGYTRQFRLSCLQCK
jgi:retron-type reverse transcriptase